MQEVARRKDTARELSQGETLRALPLPGRAGGQRQGLLLRAGLRGTLSVQGALAVRLLTHLPGR